MKLQPESLPIKLWPSKVMVPEQSDVRLLATIVFFKLAEPEKLAMPPIVAMLAVMVLLMTLSVPPLAIPPTAAPGAICSPLAMLPLMVTLVRVAELRLLLSMPPPVPLA